MNDYTLDEAKFILVMLAGRETGFTTPTQVRDAARAVLDHLSEEPEWEYGYRLVGDGGNVYKTGFAYDDPAEALERAKTRAAEENDVREETREPRLTPEPIRRRKAGPWVLIAQEGAGHEGDS